MYLIFREQIDKINSIKVPYKEDTPVGNNYPERGRVKDAASRDEAGMRSCGIIGRRVAEKLLQLP